VQIHPGEFVQVVYEVRNESDQAVLAQAVPSYAPQAAAVYFRKLECFCFTQQTLRPHESRQMAVGFVIDRAIPGYMPTVTLSYTFFKIEGARPQASANRKERDVASI